MPQRLLSLFEQIALLILIGSIPIIGKALVQNKIPPWRRTLGYCMMNSVITLGAFAVLIWFTGDDVSNRQYVIVGVASIISSLGKTKLERFAVKALEKKGVL